MVEATTGGGFGHEQATRRDKNSDTRKSTFLVEKNFLRTFRKIPLLYSRNCFFLILRIFQDGTSATRRETFGVYPPDESLDFTDTMPTLRTDPGHLSKNALFEPGRATGSGSRTSRARIKEKGHKRDDPDPPLAAMPPPC
jgi:hypothetical protein